MPKTWDSRKPLILFQSGGTVQFHKKRENITYQALPNTSASWSQRRSSSNTYCRPPWWNLRDTFPPHPTPQHGPSPQSTWCWSRTLTLVQACSIMQQNHIKRLQYSIALNIIDGPELEGAKNGISTQEDPNNAILELTTLAQYCQPELSTWGVTHDRTDDSTEDK